MFLSGEHRVLISKTHENGESVFCAEPSPDIAFDRTNSGRREISGQLRAALEALDVDNRLSAEQRNLLESARSENVSALVQRSHGLQAMRDLLYRLCEGTINGLLTLGDYADALTWLSQSMMFTVAVESCTGMAAQDFMPPTETIDTCLKQTLNAASLWHERATNRQYSSRFNHVDGVTSMVNTIDTLADTSDAPPIVVKSQRAASASDKIADTEESHEATSLSENQIRAIEVVVMNFLADRELSEKQSLNHSNPR